MTSLGNWTIRGEVMRVLSRFTLQFVRGTPMAKDAGTTKEKMTKFIIIEVRTSLDFKILALRLRDLLTQVLTGRLDSLRVPFVLRRSCWIWCDTMFDRMKRTHLFIIDPLQTTVSLS